jgi:hypothetical protein
MATENRWELFNHCCTYTHKFLSTEWIVIFIVIDYSALYNTIFLSKEVFSDNFPLHLRAHKTMSSSEVALRIQTTSGQYSLSNVTVV